MSRRKPIMPIPHYKLLGALQNIPDDAPLWTGTAVNEGEDFLHGLCLNRSGKMTKAQLLAAINASDFCEFPPMSGYDSYLLITPRLYVFKDSINQSQRFPTTPDAESYTHVVDKSNPYYDIFFRLDRENKTITFALGVLKKELSVVEYSGWCWKPTRNGLLCQNMEQLEKNFLDPFWNPIAVTVGRKVLKIRSVI